MTTQATEEGKQAPTQFDALLEDLGTLHKALESKGDEEDDEKIEAAKKGGAESEEEGEKGGTLDQEKEVKSGKASGKTTPLKKSMTVKLEDGSEVEAVDGTELVKSLEETVGALTARVETSDAVLAKALPQMVDLIKKQNSEIVELRKSLAAISNEGRGRKTVVTLAERAPADKTLAKGGDGMNPNEFMAKAESQWKAGKINGSELSFIESAFNRGQFQLPPALVSKVTAA